MRRWRLVSVSRRYGRLRARNGWRRLNERFDERFDGGVNGAVRGLGPGDIGGPVVGKPREGRIRAGGGDVPAHQKAGQRSAVAAGHRADAADRLIGRGGVGGGDGEKMDSGGHAEAFSVN
jgi:hypothetical protein